MDYVDYAFYQNVYRGFMTPSLKFPYYSDRAFEEIDARTIDLSDEDKSTDAFKKCICAVTDIKYKENESKEVESEKVGSFSVKYKDNDSASTKIQIRKVLNIYLGNTGLLYRGVDNVY